LRRRSMLCLRSLWKRALSPCCLDIVPPVFWIANLD